MSHAPVPTANEDGTTSASYDIDSVGGSGADIAADLGADLEIERYAAALYREVVRLVAHRRPGIEADDIAAEVTARFLAQTGAVMGAYPDPVHYARATARHAGVAFDRRERSQRGEGVRLTLHPDGRLAPRRRYESANVLIGDGSTERLDLVITDTEPLADRVARTIDVAALVGACLVGVPDPDRELLLLVDGLGYTVVEVADRLGQRRETVSRRINRTRRRVQQNRAGMFPNTERVAT